MSAGQAIGNRHAAIADEHESPNTIAANAVLALAREAVRMAVEHGGDQAAGALRLLLNELSPIFVAPSDTRAARRPDGADDLRLLCLSHRAACREHAKRMRSPSSAKQFGVMAETFSTLAAWLETGADAGGHPERQKGRGECDV